MGSRRVLGALRDRNGHDWNLGVITTKNNAIEIEKKLLAAMMLKNGASIPLVTNIVEAEDFHRPEHRAIFRAIANVYFQGTPPDILAVEQELNRSGARVDRTYLFGLVDAEFTTARAELQARAIKEHATRRRLFVAAKAIADAARRQERPTGEILAKARQTFDAISRDSASNKRTTFADFFAKDFASDLELTKAYAERRTGFDNLDAEQFFSPGLYVIGATPAAGKTTFCWQLLEQLARQGETCIYCSYEMSRLELFTKSLARELFVRNPKHAPTSPQIRRGASFGGLHEVLPVFANLGLNLSVLELQDESVDDLLTLLKPLCTDKRRAPVICLDYLQIVPTSYESTKLGIDDSVRKLKNFQRDTNTTFIVISSFNRTNYAHAVSFESFKESGNIEYTADVVWALQLNIMNELKSYNDVAETRRRLEEAKRRQPRQVNLKCLKNRQGTNYDCFFRYFSAHDTFEPCDRFGGNSSAPSISKEV